MALRRNTGNSKPHISNVDPIAAIAGGELYIRGERLVTAGQPPVRPQVTIGDIAAPVVIGSSSLVIVKVPEGASAGELVVGSGAHASETWSCDIGIQVAEGLHPVTKPGNRLHR